jgi:hypothetical protein
MRAAISDKPSSTILHSAIRSFHLDAASQLPRNDSLLRTIRRQRQEAPANNNDRLPAHVRKPDRGENFVLYEDEKLILFTTESNLAVLKACKHRFADGTFKVRALAFLLLLDLFGFGYAQTNFIKCVHYMDCSNHKLFNWCTVFSLAEVPLMMISSFKESLTKMTSIQSPC